MQDIIMIQTSIWLPFLIFKQMKKIIVEQVDYDEVIEEAPPPLCQMMFYTNMVQSPHTTKTIIPESFNSY